MFTSVYINMSYVAIKLTIYTVVAKHLDSHYLYKKTTFNVNVSCKHNQLKIQSKKIYPVYNVQVNKWGKCSKKTVVLHWSAEYYKIICFGHRKEIQKLTFEALTLVMWEQTDLG